MGDILEGAPESAASSPTSEFLGGVRDELPILVGVVPFGMIYGVVAVASGLSPLTAQAMSVIVFAGSAQFLMAQLYAFGTPALVMLLAAAIVNLRHALYSASVAPYLRKLGGAWKWLLAYLLTDEAFAVAITHFHKPRRSSAPDYRHFYLLGTGLALWSTWQLSTALGILLGAQIPASWSLEFTLTLTFIGMVVPSLKDRAGAAAAIAAGCVALLAFALPLKLGLVIGSLAGILAGSIVERRRP
jgi:4-azaleucine resistance transporter AzlC